MLLEALVSGVDGGLSLYPDRDMTSSFAVIPGTDAVESRHKRLMLKSRLRGDDDLRLFFRGVELGLPSRAFDGVTSTSLSRPDVILIVFIPMYGIVDEAGGKLTPAADMRSANERHVTLLSRQVFEFFPRQFIRSIGWWLVCWKRLTT